jgi:hypothetical protein
MLTVVFPYGVDSLRLHVTCDWSDLAQEAGPALLVRGYAFYPSAKEDEQGWDRYIYIQPSSSLPLVAR